jgi:hypothetical protein
MLASLACALRRLACRCWAGRVALRENRARQHRRAGPGRSEGARPKINLSKSSRSLRAKRRSVAACVGVRAAHAGCRAVRTARSRRAIVPYAPRTGGAYDSHHRTAGVAGCPRRVGVVMGYGQQLDRCGARCAHHRRGDCVISRTCIDVRYRGWPPPPASASTAHANAGAAAGRPGVARTHSTASHNGALPSCGI